jgi:hypothetical protein
MDYTYSISGTTVTIRNARNGTCIRSFAPYAKEIKNVMFSGDTISIVTECKTYVYDLKTGVTLRTL